MCPSKAAALRFTNRAPGAKSDPEAVVKSVHRVPIPRTTSASRAAASAGAVPVCPMPPRHCGWSHRSAPFPAWVSATAIPVAAAKSARAAHASECRTPPPATISGRRAPRIRAAAPATAPASGTGRRTVQTRSRNISSGKSYASACTSCGSASVTAPVSTGSVSTRIAWRSEGMSISGRQIRSKKRETGRSVSLTEMSYAQGTSSCWSTGSARRVAKTSPGSSSTGTRLTVARAAPVTRLVAPGPMDVVQAIVDSRCLTRA